ncbi:helix-turn-helix domain-containing protein [Nocardia callitridis]|uniref:HTH araC/xylS-type domain-containing protein n=1 Tax=Nocardia callitridis TaxID=648753 RepID=A0ABP9K581_9NOCA
MSDGEFRRSTTSGHTVAPNPEHGARQRVCAQQEPHLSLLGVWGLAVVSSRTVREIVEVVVRYLESVVPDGRFSFEEGAREARLRCSVPETDDEYVRVERILAGVQRIAREAFGVEVPVVRVVFRHHALREPGWYRETFGAQPTFGAEENLVGYETTALDMALPHTSERARSTCEKQCRDMLAQRRVRGGIAGSVRDLIVRDPGRLPDQVTVAAGLFVSPRTLSRWLNQEGTSYRALLDEVRQVMSEELLTHTGMTTEQVAARLGYAEAASFIRAFRRWKGCPPQEFRARVLAGRARVAAPAV